MPGKRELFTPREKHILEHALERLRIHAATWEALYTAESRPANAFTHDEIETLRRKVVSL